MFSVYELDVQERNKDFVGCHASATGAFRQAACLPFGAFVCVVCEDDIDVVFYKVDLRGDDVTEYSPELGRIVTLPLMEVGECNILLYKSTSEISNQSRWQDTQDDACSQAPAPLLFSKPVTF